ncbi:uncharacterized protein TNIN_353191 [Trichonephila inaurata madagascariensis]|uniref:Uncharacterized protein n=1 Tax=Trichonephila inaurata madagascariensis TaxID=2747483 RepID=A0A8X6I7H7_9ARAC|nr:uncharacterized protein TNIN_353191 [Trichonephila inaurata madagascariensis]
MKYNVFMHNYTPFQQWTLINIDKNGFLEELNLGQRQFLIQQNDEYEPEERYLTSFENGRHFSFDNGWSHWKLLQSHLSRNTRLNNLHLNIANFLNSVHSPAWRRVFADNFIDFSCTDSNIGAFLEEQMEVCRPVHVLKEITKRERGEIFNPFRILESIASPYYYVLPHHREGSYDRMNDIIESWRLRDSSNPYPGDDIFCFESMCRIARMRMCGTFR